MHSLVIETVYIYMPEVKQLWRQQQLSSLLLQCLVVGALVQGVGDLGFSPCAHPPKLHLLGLKLQMGLKRHLLPSKVLYLPGHG